MAKVYINDEIKDEIIDFIVENRRELTKEHVLWRYKKLSKLNNTNVFSVENDNIIGLASFFVRKLFINSIEYYIADFGHNQVLSQYSGKGIFSNLLNEATNKAASFNDIVCFCIPTNKALRIYQKQDWSQIGSLVEYSKRISIFDGVYRKTNSYNFAKVLDKIFKLISYLGSNYFFVNSKHYSLNPAKSLDKKYTEFAREMNYYYPIIRCRDHQFLKWRFFEKPLKKNEYKILELKKHNFLIGYVVILFNPDSNKAIIVDFLCQPVYFKILLKSTVEYIINAKGKDINMISIGISNKSKVKFAVISMGFFRKGKKLPVAINLFMKNRNYKSQLLDIKNWHITYADKDTI